MVQCLRWRESVLIAIPHISALTQLGGTVMKRIGYLLTAVIALSSGIAHLDRTSARADAPAVPVFDITTMPARYRDWKLISVAHEEGNLNDLRAVLGNDIAVKAYREGKLPFPDGAIVARLAWKYTSSEENNKVFGREQSFVAGDATNVQFMVKDSKKYAATGGWGYAQFNDGKAVEATALAGCYACHVPVKERDYLFTKYAK
jgi:Cytochrome P460